MNTILIKNKTRHFAQKYFYLVLSVLVMFALSACAKAAPPAELGPNLVLNAGFEEGPAHWNLSSKAAEVVDDVARNGKHSLYYINNDENRYKVFAQYIDVQPGQLLRFSVWVKGKNVNQQGTSGGAGVFIESYAGSKYVGGAFPSTAKGTFDWMKRLGEYTVPAGATRTRVGLYIRRGITGAAWFDDVEVRIVAPTPFQPNMKYPNYRGMIQQGDHKPWQVNVEIDKQPNWKNGPIQITSVLCDTNEKVLLKKTDTVASSKESATITLQPPQHLKVGNYTLKQTFINPNGDIALEREFPIKVRQQMPKVYIDAQGFTVVDEKRFFPLGIFLNPVGDIDMQRTQESGLNTILCYSYGSVGAKPLDYLKRAEEHELKVIFSLKDMYPGKAGLGEEAYDMAAKYIKMLRDKPALLAWYTNDEAGIDWVPKLAKTYKIVKELDPNHPAYQVLIRPKGLEKYFDVSDVLGTDPYPVGSANLTRTSEFTEATLAVTRDIKGMWIVPQIMDWSVYRPANKPHQPSLDEMRNQAYQALIHGATGLIWYQYYDLMYEKYPRNDSTKNMDLFHKRWQDVSAMTKEVKKIVPVILENNKVALELPEKAEVEAAAWKDGNQLLIMLANPYYEQKSITIELSQGWKIKDADQGQIKSTFADSKVTFTLPSVGSGVFRLIE